MGDTLVDAGEQKTILGLIASIVALVTIPAGLAQSVVCRGSFGERSPTDVVVIGTSWVSQDGRTEQYRARRSKNRTA